MPDRRWLAPAALGAVFLAGAMLRAAGGDALLNSSLVYSAPARQAVPGVGSPADAVRSFYLLLDQGKYAEAWALIREPDYTGTGNAPYRDEVAAQGRPGWTPREAFVSRLKDELGPSGEWLRLTAVEAEEIAGEDVGVAADGPEIAAVVRAQGTLLGACTIFHWEKQLPVIHSGGRYQVLLPGTKQAKSLFYQEWFANLQKIGTLRGVMP